MSDAHTEEKTVALLGGRYELLERIGEGGMADVHRARDIVLDRTVAVKLLRSGSDVLTSSARARNEIAVLAGLSHPSLVTLLDARLAPEHPSYLVMELIAGETLARRLKRGALAPTHAAELAVELASGLAAVHSAGVVHRDVKPSNVLIAPPSQPGAAFHAKLTDFGIASLVDGTRITAPGVVVGTAAYFAPEQLRGDTATTAVDIYALGLVLLECLTGRSAYPDATGVEAVLARLVSAPQIPSTLPTPWRRLLAGMTAMDAALRPSADDVTRAARDLAAHPSAQARRTMSARPRRTRLVGVAASIAVAIGLTASVATLSGGPLDSDAAAGSGSAQLRDVQQVIPRSGDATASSVRRGSSRSPERSSPVSASDPATAGAPGHGRTGAPASAHRRPAPKRSSVLPGPAARANDAKKAHPEKAHSPHRPGPPADRTSPSR